MRISFGVLILFQIGLLGVLAVLAGLTVGWSGPAAWIVLGVVASLFLAIDTGLLLLLRLRAHRRVGR